MNQVEVLNLGVPGYSLDQEYLLLRDEVFQYGTTRPASNPNKDIRSRPDPLADNIVQIFALTDFNAFVMVSITLVQTGLVGTALVNVDQARLAVFINGFP